MYIRTIPLVAESGYATNDAVLPAEAPSGVYEVFPVGANVVRLSCYFQHVIGEATSLIKVSCNNGFTQGNTIGSIVVRQLA